ncbi:hypothetical protein [Aeromonas sp. Marseille-Q5825]|uniref:hypothetical protein n=1 Tax=Aeromonas sp. Marseille-Q5825 TaxID=2972767 RepID=UPI0021C83A7A|nr:hypothetical protein [Aeromonas sp. Marseille-Q5825]
MGLPRFFSLQTPVVDAAAGFLIQQAAQQGNGALLAADSVQTPESLIVEAAAGFLIEQADQQGYGRFSLPTQSRRRKA